MIFIRLTIKVSTQNSAHADGTICCWSNKFFELLCGLGENVFRALAAPYARDQLKDERILAIFCSRKQLFFLGSENHLTSEQGKEF